MEGIDIPNIKIYINNNSRKGIFRYSFYIRLLLKSKLNNLPGRATEEEYKGWETAVIEVEGNDKPELDGNCDPGNISDGGWGNLSPGCCILDPVYINVIYLSINH